MKDFCAAIETKLQQMASPGIRPGLARLARLLFKAGMPQKKFPAVQIVGTNGKGSTAASLYSILRSAGYSAALYTSPHLVDFTERLVIDGGEATAEAWFDAIAVLHDIIKEDEYLSSDLPTYFELVTAAAIIILADRAPDIAVFEAGMGGRLDASNILGDVALSLIVPIGLDHTEYLGDTLLKVAAEKFAILRKETPALFMGGAAEINALFKSTAALHGAMAHIFNDEYKISDMEFAFSGTQFTLTGQNGAGRYHTPLPGTFQAENAALAVAAARLLAPKFPNVTEAAIARGIAQTAWPGRMEIISHDPLVIIDGGHNPHAALRLAETVEALAPDKKINIVLAMMKDKDIRDVLLILKRLDASVFCTQVPSSERSLAASEMALLAQEAGLHCAGAFDEPLCAIKAAAARGVPTLCCGSLFLVGHIKEHFHGF
ncbi:MAG: folylpolyglutamate synthase/dihydrofolate synthase family protein [Cloacibacillus sp.]